MSKTLTSTLAGLLYDRGLLDPEQTTGFTEWQNDNRRDITLDQLLRMISGLDHHEIAMGKDNDQAVLLYSNSTDPIEYALSKHLALDQKSYQEILPGSRFNYSSQDNQLAVKLIQDTLGDYRDMYAFYQKEFFHKIDIGSAVLEHGRDQYPLIAEGLLLSARDWARFGLLYKSRGLWKGEQIISQRWIDYSLTPTDENVSYGAGVALNTGKHLFPDLPEDTFALMGAWERYVVVVPSADVIVVRIGFSQPDQREGINRLVADILDVLEQG